MLTWYFLTLWIKKCRKCNSYCVQKWGRKRGKQNYKCTNCSYSFQNKSRIKKNRDDWVKKAYHQYAMGRQTLESLSELKGKSTKTLQRIFDANSFVTGEIKTPKNPTPVTIDATYFKRRDGVLIVRANGRNVVWREIETERMEDYEKLADMLMNAGMKISAFTIDGRRGVLHMLERRFPNIPVQLCQFHQIQTITNYLSKNPKLEAGKELRGITLSLTETNYERFSDRLKQWHKKWKDFMDEKTFNPLTNRKHFTHRRLRSAYRSLNTNLPWLFTHQKYPELKIPNTTNSCDGSFAHWKGRLTVHRGMHRSRKRNMMHYLLENS